MNTYYAEVESMLLLPEDCWILKKGHILYNNSKRTLPYLIGNYSEFFEALGIPYKVDKNVNVLSNRICVEDEITIFWDPEIEEYEEVTAPIYYLSNNKYRYAKNHTDFIPSEDMVEAATNLSCVIQSKINNFDVFMNIKTSLKGKVSTICRSQINLGDYSWKDETFKVISFCISNGFHYNMFSVIFNINKIIENEYHYLILTIPDSLKSISGSIIGKNHSRVLGWVESLKQYGIKGIYVK